MSGVMQSLLLRVLFILLALLGLGFAFVAADSNKPRILIAGDSTAERGSMRRQIYGWGEPFAELFDSSKVRVINLARGGRSSRTFITEGLWDILLAKVRTGDIVLIQFGHNDGDELSEPSSEWSDLLRARGSLPGIGEETAMIERGSPPSPELVHTFGWYLRKMVADVRERGGKPILLSPTLENRWSEDGQIVSNSAYRRWTGELAASEGVPFVDLAQIRGDDYQARGWEAVATFFSRDIIHTNKRGAAHTAALVLSGLKGLRGEAAISDLDSLLSEKGRESVPAE